jgi:hypothetical protein
MRIKIFIFLSFIFSSFISAQTLTTKDFKTSEWFSDNTDSLFFKTDTIKLIKYSNISDFGYYENDSHMDAECVRFQFNRVGNMRFWVIYYHIATLFTDNEWTWKIFKKSNELRIYRNSNLEFSLIPISERKLEFSYNGQNFLTTEITMKKNK